MAKPPQLHIGNALRGFFHMSLVWLTLNCPAPAPADDGPPLSEVTIHAAGPNEAAAVAAALVQAVDQVNGLKIEQKSVLSHKYRDAVDDLKNAFTDEIIGTQVIRKASSGLIDGYDVLSETQDPATKFCTVQLRVRIPVWNPQTALLAGHRKVIAVLPFRCARDGFDCDGQNTPADVVKFALADRLVQTLTQSRKFTVLDRDFLAELGDERRFLIDANTAPMEQLRLGHQLGADFLVVGTINELSYGRSSAGTRVARAAVSYRVVNVATGRDHYAGSYGHVYAADELAALPPIRAQLRPVDLLAQDSADDIADQIITGVFPIRVIAVDGATVILNQGGIRVAEGTELDIYNEGKELIDPDTNESLGPAEVRIGRIKVGRVTSKLSYASVTEGDIGAIKPQHAICLPFTDPAARYRRSATTSMASGHPRVVIAVASGASLDDAAAASLKQCLEYRGAAADARFFTSAAVTDGVIARLINGSLPQLKALGLPGSCDYVLICTKEENLAARPDLRGMILGDGKLALNVIRTEDGLCIDHFNIQADTSAFRPDKAEARLIENFIAKVDEHGFGSWLPPAVAGGPTRP